MARRKQAIPKMYLVTGNKGTNRQDKGNKSNTRDG